MGRRGARILDRGATGADRWRATVYELIVFIHVLSAIVWVGGAFVIQVFAILSQRSTDPNDLPRLGRQVEFVGLRVFLPASILLFVAGLIMTAQRWGFGQPWISISMLLWIVSVLVGALYLGPRSRKVAELIEAEGPSSVAARSLMSRLFVVSRLELVSFAFIVALMVFKPGSISG
jgi:uncharacterized membrane protein